LIDLHGRVHRGAYQAKPSRRVYIEKEDGRKRPLGVAALEDKIVQHAVGTILNQIYEEGSVISPLLANIYLHYCFDLWVNVWRKKGAQGEVVVVRYADDTVLGFQYQADADRFLENLKERLAVFGLELHPEKTRRIEVRQVRREEPEA
jgi:retron-type reverse transcriptase